MKKYLLTLMAFALMFTLTACGNGESSKNNENNNNVEEKNGEGETNKASSTTDDFEFYSDNTKLVFQSGNSKLIYYYTGDTVTAYHAYIDYENAATANYALTLLQKDKDETIDKMYTKGRYVVVEYNKSEYEDMSVNDIRTAYSYLTELKKAQ